MNWSAMLRRGIVFWSAVCGLWFGLWVVVMLSLYNGLPGLFSLTGDDGAWELSTYLLNLPGWQLVIAVGLTACLATTLVGLAGRWLDPKSRGVEALRWSLSSSAITAAFAFAPPSLLLLLLLVPDSAASAVGMLLMLGSILVFWLLPFWAWNREILARPVPSLRWRPRWPGWVALAALLAWAAAPAFGESAAMFAMAMGAGLVGGLLLILTVLAELLMPVWAVMFWLNPRGPRAATHDHRWALAWPSLGSWLWLWLAQLLIAAALLLPIFLAAALSIYAAPQMAVFEQSVMSPGSTTLDADALAKVLAVMSTWGMFAAFPSLSALQLLALGRLLNQRKLEREQVVSSAGSDLADRESLDRRHRAGGESNQL